VRKNTARQGTEPSIDSMVTATAESVGKDAARQAACRAEGQED